MGAEAVAPTMDTTDFCAFCDPIAALFPFASG